MDANKYQDGKIYKIECKTTGLIYIGSTIEKYLSQRLARHKQYQKDAKNNNLKSRNLNITSLLVLENENYFIELIENFPCNNKQDLLWRERYWIERTDCVNIAIPIHSYDEIQQRLKEYKTKNEKKIKEYKAKWFKDNYEPSYNKVFNKMFETEDDKDAKRNKKQEKNKEYCKNYYEENKEKYKEEYKKSYEQNSEKYKEKAKLQREKIKNDPELYEKLREYKKLKAREYREKKKKLC